MHPFEKAKSAEDVLKALAKNDLFKKAIDEALKAKKAQEQRFKENKNLADAGPDQVARLAFLRVLCGEKAEKK